MRLTGQIGTSLDNKQEVWDSESRHDETDNTATVFSNLTHKFYSGPLQKKEIVEADFNCSQKHQ